MQLGREGKVRVMPGEGEGWVGGWVWRTQRSGRWLHAQRSERGRAERGGVMSPMGAAAGKREV
jgi:hypothetical protein